MKNELHKLEDRSKKTRKTGGGDERKEGKWQQSGGYTMVETTTTKGKRFVKRKSKRRK